MRSALLVWTAALGLVCAAPAARAGQGAGKGKEAAKDLTPAEAARKALDQKVTLDFLGQSLQEVIDHLRQKTKVNFVLENVNFGGFPGMPGGPGPFPGGGPVPPGGVPGGAGGQVHLKIKDGKLREAVRSLLNQFHQFRLTYVILADRVAILHENQATARQLQQRVTLDLNETPLRDALKQLGRETGASLIIDPAAAKQSRAPVTLQIDDTTLETGVRLLTELGGLKTVQMGNVLFVTTEAKADKIRREGASHQPTGPRGIYHEVPATGFGWAGQAGVVLPAGPALGRPNIAPPPPLAPPPPQKR
jgi:hypothetical protein